jgi:twitching motility protein PilI
MAQQSSRQSLKALQERLAERLAAAKRSGVEASWLAVESAGGRWLLPLVHSGEIAPVAAVQAVPYTRSWFLGVVALRGSLMGVVDLGQMLASAGCGTPVSFRPEGKLVALNASLGVNAVLLVDKLIGLRSASQFQGVRPRQGESLPFFAQRLTDAQGVEWQELNLQSLVEWPDFLNVVA